MTAVTWEQSPGDVMKVAVLRSLRGATQPVSGADLCRQLGATRNAVWKCVRSLRSLGYQIAGTTNAGYRLLASPDCPFAWEVAEELSTSQIGRTVVYMPEMASTNDLARQMARDGAPHGTLVVADTQTAGRGRRGRTWVSPPGAGLWMSILLRPPLPPTEVTLFPLLAGVAVTQVLRQWYGMPALLKWPNDVLVAERKICGILLEMSAEADVLHHLVLGIGVNVNLVRADFPPDLQDHATSLQLEMGEPQARVPLLRRIITEIEREYIRFISEGPGCLLNQARLLSATMGKTVDVKSADSTVFTGTAIAIADDGALLVRDATGLERPFYAGDVSVRPAGAGGSIS